MSHYIWRAHSYAREAEARRAYRAARARAIRRGFTGTLDDRYFLDALAARIRWLAYLDLVEGVERAAAELERAEAAHAA